VSTAEAPGSGPPGAVAAGSGRRGSRRGRWRPQPPAAVGVALLTPVAALLALVFVVPFLRLFWLAFSEPTFGLQNFQTFFETSAYVRAMVTTLRVSVLVTLLAVILGTMIAWELRTSGSRVWRALLWSAVLFPLWESVVVRNYAFTILLQREGLVNDGLLSLGLVEQPLGILYTEAGVTIGMLYTMLPFAILPLYASFASIDMNLLRAAEGLGASRLRAFFSVVVPLSVSSLLAAAAIVFVVSLGFYITPILLGGAQTPFVATIIDQQIYSVFNLPLAAATSTVLFVVALLILAGAWRAVGFERIQRTVA
jgi:ABC-type spermidine/putrescine transport system permease subunit I